VQTLSVQQPGPLPHVVWSYYPIAQLQDSITMQANKCHPAQASIHANRCEASLMNPTEAQHEQYAVLARALLLPVCCNRPPSHERP
jgi:hypothetical protein